MFSAADVWYGAVSLSRLLCCVDPTCMCSLLVFIVSVLHFFGAKPGWAPFITRQTERCQEVWQADTL